VLARAVDAKTPGRRNHCEAVFEPCARSAFTLGLDDARIEHLRLAGLLHDISTNGIPDRILRKPQRLTPDEAATKSSSFASAMRSSNCSSRGSSSRPPRSR
jgi:HD-GYP domain-containing protein (c-di-GMP phosphodiesterase class II)